MADEVTEPTRDQAIDAMIHLGRSVSNFAGPDAVEALKTIRLRVQILERQLDERGVAMLQDAAGKRALPLPLQATCQGGPMDGQMVDIGGPHVQWRDEVLVATPDADPADPLSGQAIIRVWMYHLYSDGTYRLERIGGCPTMLTENPDGGNGG